ncbi:MAG: CoA-binding protein [Chitinophagales bacterium]|nr:CoA-binding protein [Chitinophagales bacterium]
MDTEKKFTVLLGASADPSRYAYLAVNRLVQHGHKVLPIGIRQGEVAGVPIVTDHPVVENVDTVTLYLNPKRQQQYYEYILSLHPERIIFNPGTENEELAKLAEDNGIKVTEACTLVLLGTGQY